MSTSQHAAAAELASVLENDVLRGGATRELLAVRRAAVDEAAAAHERFAYRQALLELAACALGLAARLPAPAAPVPRLARGGANREKDPHAGSRLTQGRASGARRAA
jgi:hypothetical protein